MAFRTCPQSRHVLSLNLVAGKAVLGDIGGMERWGRTGLVAIPLALLLISIFLNPVPLVGGLTDDYRYLVGAHCLTCVPTNHWESRFLIVWPTGAAIELFGLNFWSVMIFPIVASLAATILLFKVTEREFGPLAAAISASILVLTPIFGERAMRIGVDVPELALLIGAVFVLQRNYWAGWAGILLALAVLTRPTELAALPMLGFLAAVVGRRDLLWFAAAFVATIGAHMLLYWALVGDPLYYWTLAMRHTTVPSWLLSPGVDTSRSPLFNPDFIGGWIPGAQIKAHWTVQGLINLMLNEDIAVTLWTCLVFVGLSLKRLRRLHLFLLGSACLYFGALTYAFAIDPEPRMFMPVAAIAAAVTGSLTPGLFHGPYRLVVMAFFGLIALVGVDGVFHRNDYRDGAQTAARLISTGSYELTPRARERLALIVWNARSRPGHLIDIDHQCHPSVRSRRLIASGEDICIYD